MREKAPSTLKKFKRVHLRPFSIFWDNFWDMLGTVTVWIKSTRFADDACELLRLR